jgi:hypothetical protein
MIFHGKAARTHELCLFEHMRVVDENVVLSYMLLVERFINFFCELQRM